MVNGSECSSEFGRNSPPAGNPVNFLRVTWSVTEDTMKKRAGFLLLLFALCLGPVTGRYVPVVPFYTNAAKQDWIGSWIQNSEWFPIEVNVPDTISNIGQGITNAGQGISTAVMNWGSGFGDIIQRIPWINRIISQVRPRPHQRIVVLIPVEEVINIVKQHESRTGGKVHFNPFDREITGFAPMYP